MERPKRPRGRPEGQQFDVIKQVRLAGEDADRLAALAREWRCSESAAIRRAIQEVAKLHGV